MYDYFYLGKNMSKIIIQKYIESKAGQGQGSEPCISKPSCYPGNRISFSKSVLKNTYI